MKQEIYDGFDNREDMCYHFGIDPDSIADYRVLYAAYGGGAYDGSAKVILEKDNKLFIVEAWHCSCYGLNGMWEMIETTPELLDNELDPDRCLSDIMGLCKWWQDIRAHEEKIKYQDRN